MTWQGVGKKEKKSVTEHDIGERGLKKIEERVINDLLPTWRVTQYWTTDDKLDNELAACWDTYFEGELRYVIRAYRISYAWMLSWKVLSQFIGPPPSNSCILDIELILKSCPSLLLNLWQITNIEINMWTLWWIVLRIFLANLLLNDWFNLCFAWLLLNINEFIELIQYYWWIKTIEF